MNEESRQWRHQYYSNLGVKELFRFGCFTSLLVSLGIVLGDIFNAKWLLLVIGALLFILSAFSLVWKPIYLIHRKILGNPNLPTEPMHDRRMIVPRSASPSIPRWYYVPAVLFAILKIVIASIVMYFIITYILLK